MTYHGFSEVGPMTKEAEEQCVKNKFSYYNVESTLKYISGQILTIVEATISDQEQRKATKDIVKRAFRDTMVSVYNEATEVGTGSVE